MSNTLIIRIDEDLEEFVPDFIENRKQDVVSIKSLLEKKDYKAIRTIGHSMKGSGTSYGFSFISEIGKKIEDAAKSESAQIIVEKNIELANFLDCIEIEFVSE